PAMREGTQHTLEVIRLNPEKYAPYKIESMDLRFEEVLDNIDLCPNCRYDIKFKNEYTGNGIPKFGEFKSYSPQTWMSIKTSPEFLQQFERYLQDISSLDDLQYIFNSSKATSAQV